MILKKKCLSLLVVLLLLTSSISAFAESPKEIPSDFEVDKAIIVAYDELQKEEIFGDLSENQIDDILINIAREAAGNKKSISKTEIHEKNNLDIDTSKITIKEFHEEGIEIDKEQNIPSFENLNIRESLVGEVEKTFNYIVYLTHIDGSEISAKYKSTVTAALVPPYRSKYYIDDIYTRARPGNLYAFRFRHNIGNTKNRASVRFSHVNLEYTSFYKLTFVVNDNGFIFVD